MNVVMDGCIDNSVGFVLLYTIIRALFVFHTINFSPRKFILSETTNAEIDLVQMLLLIIWFIDDVNKAPFFDELHNKG